MVPEDRRRLPVSRSIRHASSIGCADRQGLGAGACVRPSHGLSPDVLEHHPLKGVAVKPTPKQLAYLKTLAAKTGTTFAYPQTRQQASAEIKRLQAQPRSSAGDARRERRAVQRDLQTRPDDATAIRPRDVRGYGSSARWAHRPLDGQEPTS